MDKKAALKIDRSDSWKTWVSTQYFDRSFNRAPHMSIDSLLFGLREVSKAAKRARALNNGDCVIGFEIHVHRIAQAMSKLWLGSYKMEDTRTVEEVQKRYTYHASQLLELGRVK